MKFRLSLVALCLAATISISAQQGAGTIQGTVFDPQGAVVPGAEIQVKNVDTNQAFDTESNEAGSYAAPGLAVGAYEVSVSSPGFKHHVRSGVTLQVNQNALVNLTLEVGQVSESVEVRADVALVDAGGPTIGAVIERRRVADLPLNGRSALALTLLNPGVISNAGPTASGFGDRGVQLSALSINGGPNSMNAQMLDGNNNTLSYIGEVGVPPAVDSVEEFKVQSGSMSAEFGFTAGGAVNLVTRSGGNQIHGTLYEFLRNDALDARNTYSTDKLPLRYNQFGASVGGPIIKNKTFGFFNWEEYRLRDSSPRITSVPIDSFRRGDFGELRSSNGSLVPIYDPSTLRANPEGAGMLRDPFLNNVIPQSRLDAVSSQVVDFWPSPNRTPINAFTQAQNFQDASKVATDWTQWNGKLDHSFGAHNSLFFRYTQAEHDLQPNSIFADPTVGSQRYDNQLNRNAVLSDTHLFSPTLINNFRVGISRQSFDFVAANYGHDWPSRLGLPANVPQDQMPQIDFGYGQIGGGAAGVRGSLNWDIQNMTTWVVRKHVVKVGANYRDLYGGNRQGSALSGRYRFNGLTANPQSPSGTGADMAQFLLGDVRSAIIDKILGNSWHGHSVSFFLQDDWKLTQRLTFNLGLRYDYQSKPVERFDGHINFDPSCTLASGIDGCTVFANHDGQPRSFRDEDYNDFGPRFGFAYDLTGKGKTVLRGGYGVYYPSIFWPGFFGDTNLFSQTRTSYTGPSNEAAFRLSEGFPFAPIEAIGRAGGADAFLGQSVSLTESGGTTPLGQQWSLGLQHQVGDWMFDVSYAGNKGNHFVAGNYDLNQIDPALYQEFGLALFDPVPNPLSGLVPGTLGRSRLARAIVDYFPFPGYQSVIVDNPLMGNYNSQQLQISVRKRFSHGLLLDFAFTGGKRISDSIDTPVNFGNLVEQVGFISYQDGLYNRQAEKSIDPTDVSRRLVISGIYELPFGNGKRFDAGNGWNKLVGGWQVNTIGTLQTGVPVVVYGADNFTASRPDSTGVSARLSKDERTPERWFDTNPFVNPPLLAPGNLGRVLPDVRNPGVVNWDLSLIKDTHLTERFNLQFRAEAFNFLNHANYGLADGAFQPGADGTNSNAGFGVIAFARDARVMQMGVKLIF